MSGAFGQKRGRAHSRGILRTLAAVEVPQVLDPASSFPVVLTRATGARFVIVMRRNSTSSSGDTLSAV